MKPILSADPSVRTNAELIRSVAQLHLSGDPLVLDCTYGRGAWWREWRPARLVASDLVSGSVLADFTSLPFSRSVFDVVAFDPPYVPMGGRRTSTLSDFNERYGRHVVPSSPERLRDLIAAGLLEARRVLKPGGLLLVKCANYVWSGRLQPATAWTFNDLTDAGFSVVDWFVLVGSARPQPARSRRCEGCGGSGCDDCQNGRVVSRQHHSRQNTSYLFVAVRGGDNVRDDPTLWECV